MLKNRIMVNLDRRTNERVEKDAGKEEISKAAVVRNIVTRHYAGFGAKASKTGIHK